MMYSFFARAGQLNLTEIDHERLHSDNSVRFAAGRIVFHTKDFKNSTPSFLLDHKHEMDYVEKS